MPRSVSCRRRAAFRPAGRAAGRCRSVRSKGDIAARTSTGSAAFDNDDDEVAAEQTAAVANLLLVDHERSVKRNIEKDIALTEATGRQYDTMHFNMFCAAWSNTFERELYTKKGRLDTQQEIEEKRAEVKMAKKTK